MLFVNTAGEGTVVDGSPKRTKPILDRKLIAFARGETFERYKSLGFSIEAISSIFNVGASTIHADLKRLADERARRAAEGVDPLPLLGT